MLRIKDLREENNLTPEDVAKALGVTVEQYNMFETGEKCMSYENLIELAKFYNTNIDYILGLTNEKKPYPVM